MSTLADSILEASKRIVAMQKIIVPGAQAKPYASWNYPYSNLFWTNAVGAIQPGGKVATNEYAYQIPFTMRLHTGLVQQGYDGKLEETLMYEHIPNVLTYFDQFRTLQYKRGTTPIDNYRGTELVISCSGFRSFNVGDDQTVLGAEFVLALPFQVNLQRSTQ